MKKIGNKLVVLGATVLILLGATGCSSKLEKAQESINDNIVNVLNHSEQIDGLTNAEFDKYVFLSGDFNYTDNGNYIVDINGLASYNNNSQKAYVTLQYEVSENVFKNLDADKSHEVINALCDVVNEYDMKSCSFTPMNNITEFNSKMGQVFESPVDNYQHQTSLTYKVNDIEFNEQEGYVSFKTKSNVKYYNRRTELQYTMVGVDSKGNPKMGWRTVVRTDYEYFNQDYQIYIRVSPQEMQAMKEDNAKIFDKFVELVKTDNKQDITVRSTGIQADKAFDDGAGYSM